MVPQVQSGNLRTNPYPVLFLMSLSDSWIAETTLSKTIGAFFPHSAFSIASIAFLISRLSFLRVSPRSLDREETT